MDFSAGRGDGKRCEERVRETGEGIRLPEAEMVIFPGNWDIIRVEIVCPG